MAATCMQGADLQMCSCCGALCCGSLSRAMSVAIPCRIGCCRMRQLLQLFASASHDGARAVLQSAVGGETIQNWMPPEAVRGILGANYSGLQSPNANLYNAMVAPLAGVPLSGAVYYQVSSKSDSSAKQTGKLKENTQTN